MKNQWSKIASETEKIQDAKNKVLNNKVSFLVDKYINKNGKAFNYGCGWGEFANILVKKGFKVGAYDDADEMIEKARVRYKKPKFLKKKEFYKKIPSFKNKFNLVVSNLVLCILKKKDQRELLENIITITKKDGVMILSFCHPCFEYITEGIVSKRIRPYEFNPKYNKEFKYRKVVHENRIGFDDYHRPLEYYVRLFEKHKLEIVDIAESDVLDTEFYPDFIIFVLKKKVNQYYPP